MKKTEIISLLKALDSTSYGDIIDAVNRDEGEVLYFSEGSGIIFQHNDGVYYIASLGPDKSSFIKHLPDRGLATVHGQWEAEYMMENLGYEKVEPTYLYVYEGNPLEKNGNIRVLDESYLDFILSHYGTSSEEDIKAAMDNKHLYGAFSGDELMGFAGFHMEGSMGMLVVLPEYRRRGVGETLEKYLIATALEEGRLPYCNVFVSNKASISLQEKLGLKRGKILSWWTWTE